MNIELLISINYQLCNYYYFVVLILKHQLYLCDYKIKIIIIIITIIMLIVCVCVCVYVCVLYTQTTPKTIKRCLNCYKLKQQNWAFYPRQSRIVLDKMPSSVAWKDVF